MAATARAKLVPQPIRNSLKQGGDSMFEHKIIFTGPVGAGKTTLISGKSDIEIKPIVTYIGIGYRF